MSATLAVGTPLSSRVPAWRIAATLRSASARRAGTGCRAAVFTIRPPYDPPFDDCAHSSPTPVRLDRRVPQLRHPASLRTDEPDTRHRNHVAGEIPPMSMLK